VREPIHGDRLSVRKARFSHKQKIRPANDNARKETTQDCRSQSAFGLVLFVPLFCDLSDIHVLIIK
jgi:hypothetical protein